MATQEDVRRIALSLPQASEAADHLGFGVPNKGKLKGFAWAWNERIEPKKPRVPNLDVLVVRVANLAEKEELLSADPEKFFTEPHYNGFPAVLVRLSAIDVGELAELLTDAWRCQAPRALTAGFDRLDRHGLVAFRAQQRPSSGQCPGCGVVDEREPHFRGFPCRVNDSVGLATSGPRLSLIFHDTLALPNLLA
jgi:hypothetical protein